MAALLGICTELPIAATLQILIPCVCERILLNCPLGDEECGVLISRLRLFPPWTFWHLKIGSVVFGMAEMYVQRFSYLLSPVSDTGSYNSNFRVVLHIPDI